MTPQEELVRGILTAQVNKLALKPTDVLVIRMRHLESGTLERVVKAARSVLDHMKLSIPVLVMPTDMSVHKMDKASLERCLKALIEFPGHREAQEAIQDALTDAVSNEYLITENTPIHERTKQAQRKMGTRRRYRGEKGQHPEECFRCRRLATRKCKLCGTPICDGHTVRAQDDILCSGCAVDRL